MDATEDGRGACKRGDAAGKSILICRCLYMGADKAADDEQRRNKMRRRVSFADDCPGKDADCRSLRPEMDAKATEDRDSREESNYQELRKAEISFTGMRQQEGSNWLTLGKDMKEWFSEALRNDRLRMTSAVSEPDTAGNVQIEEDIVTNLPRMANSCDEKYLEDLTKAYDLAFCSGRWLDFDPKHLEKADLQHEEEDKQQGSQSNSFLPELETIESREQAISLPATCDAVFEEDESVSTLQPRYSPRKEIAKNPEHELLSLSILRPGVRVCHSCSQQERWQYLKQGMPPIHQVRIINGFAKYLSNSLCPDIDDKIKHCTHCRLELARKARTINSKARFTILPVLTLSGNGIVPPAWSKRASNGKLNRFCNGGWSKNLCKDSERLGWETISSQKCPSGEGLRFPEMNSTVWILEKLQKAKQEAFDAKLALQKGMVNKDYLNL